MYIYIIGVIVICVAFFLLSNSRSVEQKKYSGNEFTEYFRPDRVHDTIYFRVIDEFGVKSYLHDSGISISSDEIPNQFDLNIIKKEINDGNIQELGRPRLITYGRKISDLNYEYVVPQNQIKDKNLYYIVRVHHFKQK